MNTSSPVWVWDYDRELIFDGGPYIEESYNLSSADTIDFWDVTAPVDFTGKIIYVSTDSRIGKLKNYSYFPMCTSTPVVDSELKAVVEAVCDAGEVAFHPCEIHSRSNRIIHAWNMYPLNQIRCVDEDLSELKWFVPNLNPENKRIEAATKVVFKENCLGFLNIARPKEIPSRIILSDKLKTKIEEHNSKGICFKSEQNFHFR
jgi:hypothetical protein